ncbi:MAG: hypothetical protein Q9213_007092 [Squamulea squamosa]
MSQPRDVLFQELSRQVLPSATPGLPNRAEDGHQNYEIIGLGTCGTVFEIPATQQAIKKGKDVTSLWNDFILTNVIHNAFADVSHLLQHAFPDNTIPQVPRCRTFHLPFSNIWESALYRFPESHREIGGAFHVDRIPTLPRPVREALIDQYFNKRIRKRAKVEKNNQTCLARIYLGEQQSDTKTQRYDSLWNFPLPLNMVEDLRLDKELLADEMAIALAVIHWQAQVDAMDTEFVLGSSGAESCQGKRAYVAGGGPHEVHDVDLKTRNIHMWVLDFDKSKSIELIPGHVGKLVAAFLGNDPYYPRPDVSERLRIRFNNTYLKASHIILQHKLVSDQAMGLPRAFIEGVEVKIEEHKDWNAEEDIVFG